MWAVLSLWLLVLQSELTTSLAGINYYETEQHNSLSYEDQGLSLVPLKPSAVRRTRRSPLDAPPPMAEPVDGGQQKPQQPPSVNGEPNLSRGQMGIEEEVSDDKLNLPAVDIPDEAINETLRKHTTEFDNDLHKYYDYECVDFSSYWVDLDKLNDTQNGIVQEHSMLSESYRRAATISLQFPFPFYGHEVKNITIATGGFLYLGQYVHSWLAATQYIAPLMANFDTSVNKEAKIRFADTGDAFIVEWMKVHLQGQNNAMDVYNTSSGSGESGEAEQQAQSIVDPGPFTFQVILNNTGDIVFVYKTIPFTIANITDDEHPVKVGLSDAYIIDRTIFFVRRKTIYEYHRVSLKSEFDISNNTAVYFRALPTCNRFKTCKECLAEDRHKDNNLKCKWCSHMMACSDGMDRNRQGWLQHSCQTNNVKQASVCDKANADAINANQHGYNPHQSYPYPDQGPGGFDHSPFNGDGSLPEAEDVSANSEASKVTPHHAGIATVVVLACLLTGCMAWFGYAYFVPHSWSGQLLIKYRPSRWHWLSGGTQYTAASIHM